MGQTTSIPTGTYKSSPPSKNPAGYTGDLYMEIKDITSKYYQDPERLQQQTKNVQSAQILGSRPPPLMPLKGKLGRTNGGGIGLNIQKIILWIAILILVASIIGLVFKHYYLVIVSLISLLYIVLGDPLWSELKKNSG